MEDHVSEETMPEKQNPVVYGDKQIKISTIDPNLLAIINKNLNAPMHLFYKVENKGLEDEIFTSVDSNFQKLFSIFKQKVESKMFFEPVEDCADFYYKKLIINPELTRLHNSIRRNYAADLQDGAQQALNKLLTMERAPNGFSKTSEFNEFKKYPKQLERAAEILGPDHYLFPALQARKYYFEGYLILLNRKQGIDVENGKIALEKFNQAIHFQPNFPQVYIALSQIYGYMYHQMDSMEYFALRAAALAPLWLEPSLSLAFNFTYLFNNYELSRKYLNQAIQIDSNSLETLEAIGNDLNYQGKFSEAERYYKKVIALDSFATLTYINLGLNYLDTKSYADAEMQFLKAIQLDSTLEYPYRFIGNTYNATGQFFEAVNYFKKAIQLDSTVLENYINLGFSYFKLNEFYKAEFQYNKVIKMSPNNWKAHTNLGDLYLKMNRNIEAKHSYEKSLLINTKNKRALYGLAIIHARNMNISDAFKSLELCLRAGFVNYEAIINEQDFKLLQLQKEQWSTLLGNYFPSKYSIGK